MRSTWLTQATFMAVVVGEEVEGLVGAGSNGAFPVTSLKPKLATVPRDQMKAGFVEPLD